MKLPTKAPLTILGAAFALSLPTQAYALSCDEIMNMVNVNVPANIVVQTMKDSGDVFGSDDISCLTSRGAPSEVVAQAKRMSAGPEPEPEAAPTRAVQGREAAPSAPANRMDADDDVIGGRSTKRQSAYEDLPEKGNDAADPDAIKDAIKLLKAKKPLTASYQLYNMLEDNRFPEHATKIHYYLARSLQELEMYHTAQYHYMQVVKKGPSNPYFSYALPKLVAIARFTGDDSELMRIVSKIPPDSFPRGAKNHMFYLLGVRSYDKESLSKARKYFSQVSTKSPLYLKSEYYRGTIYNEQGKLKSAVRSFRDVYREEVSIANNARDLREVEKIKDLALMNVARIYYGIERFDEATKYYDLVPRQSKYWAESLFESAWSNFMQNNLNHSLGQVLTVQSPFFDQDEFLPEATVLRALTFFNLCQYDEVEKMLLDFESTHRTMQTEMKDFVKDYSSQEGSQMADQAWNTYFGSQRKIESVLPKSLFNKILRNQSLAGLVNHMNLMDQEIALIDQQKQRWSEGVGTYLKKIIEADRQRYEKRAGRILLSEMANNYNQISNLMTQSEIIRFEVVDAQRVDYQYKARNVDLASAESRYQIDFATAVEFIYWPFNGEFWEDELEYYHYTEKSTCK